MVFIFNHNEKTEKSICKKPPYEKQYQTLIADIFVDGGPEEYKRSNQNSDYAID